MTLPDPGADRPMAATESATPSGRAPAIILLHGAFLNREVWAGYDATLGPGYRTLALDMTPGRAARGAPFRLPDAVERIESTILDECGGSAIVVGYSLGG
jgi:pimeloyl-ACP methyl ester carboxylesterase